MGATYLGLSAVGWNVMIETVWDKVRSLPILNCEVVSA